MQRRYTIACFVPRNFVRHDGCRMLCALPVTRILNTEFKFFFHSRWNTRVCNVGHYWFALSLDRILSLALTIVYAELDTFSLSLSLFFFRSVSLFLYRFLRTLRRKRKLFETSNTDAFEIIIEEPIEILSI